MMNYIGADCPVCKRIFAEADRPDMVVCPDCGAPYHRACYAVGGHCVYEAVHKKGFVWKCVPPAKPKVEPEQLNEPSAVPHVSVNLTGGESREFGSAGRDGAEDGFFSELNEALGRLGTFEEEKASFEKRFIFGVSEKEILYFQGGMNPVRLMRFRRIAEGKKISVNIFAALFSPYYLFYSRMRAAGFMLAAVFFLLKLPNYILLLFGTGEGFSDSLMSAANLLGLFDLALTVALALFFDYFYLRWMVYKIKQIRYYFDDAEEDAPAEELTDTYYRALQGMGKPSVLYMLLDSVAVYAALFLVFYMILNSAF